MSQFLGTHTNRLDAKGRVSIPAPFRTALRTGSQGADAAVVLRPSHKYPCVEAWPALVFNSLAIPLDQVDIFDSDQDDVTTALYADAWPVEADKDGRIILPDSLVRHAALSDTVVFMGAGWSFQMWEPAAAARRTAQARENARTRGLKLRAAP